MNGEAIRNHTYDGIEEFDNRLPNWWLWTFYGACIFSILYWVHYHTIGIGELPGEAYVREQKAAAARLEQQMAANPVSDEMLLKLANEPAFVAEGERIFTDPAQCALCHKGDGSGLVGPNLTDDLWIYGGKPMDVYRTILEGRAPDPARGFMGGMPEHASKGTQYVLRATTYVLSDRIRHTNRPGKPPEPNAKPEQDGQ